MGMLEDVFEHSLPGVVIGALASAIILPMVGGRAASPGADGRRRRANPLMRAAVRGYVNVSDRIKEYTAEAREQLQDLAAKAREERRMEAESAAASEAAAPQPGATSPSPGQA
jgi:hypothetical protein